MGEGVSHTVVSLLPRDAIPSIDDPTFDVSYEGNGDETVVVVETSDGARAYPARVLQNHEVVNDDVDGDPIAVTWCPLCASGVVYDRRVEGRVLTFGVSGKLADNDLVLYDRETNSEWKQSSGVCLDGPLSGTTLTARPASVTTWQAFTESYPDGVTLREPAWAEGDYETDRFRGYADSDFVGPGGDQRLRTRIEAWGQPFDPKAPTLGVVVDGEARGFPRPVVEANGGVVTDTVGETPVAVFATGDGLFGYESDLSFERTGEGRFRGDGTTWNPVTGAGADGRRLDRLPARRLFAFAWQDDHGEGAFYR